MKLSLYNMIYWSFKGYLGRIDIKTLSYYETVLKIENLNTYLMNIMYSFSMILCNENTTLDVCKILLKN